MFMSYRAIFITVCAAWCLSECLLVAFRRSEKGSRKRDAGTVFWLNAVIYVSVAAGVCATILGVGRIRVGIEDLGWIGLGVLVAGLLIRWWAIIVLWKYFTVDVAISPEHRLLDTGIYGIIRHPSYLGTIISALGLALALSNWVALVAIPLPIAGMFIKRISVEERALTEAFGDVYVEYCARTRRLVPFLY
jgi:protein-S-isoprenylcysteine O-methyltransferase